MADPRNGGPLPPRTVSVLTSLFIRNNDHKYAKRGFVQGFLYAAATRKEVRITRERNGEHLLINPLLLLLLLRR